MKVYVLSLYDYDGSEYVDKVFASYSAMITFVKEELGDLYNGVVNINGYDYNFLYKEEPEDGWYYRCEVHELIGMLQPKDYVNCI